MKLFTAAGIAAIFNAPRPWPGCAADTGGWQPMPPQAGLGRQALARQSGSGEDGRRNKGEPAPDLQERGCRGAASMPDIRPDAGAVRDPEAACHR